MQDRPRQMLHSGCRHSAIVPPCCLVERGRGSVAAARTWGVVEAAELGRKLASQAVQAVGHWVEGARRQQAGQGHSHHSQDV